MALCPFHGEKTASMSFTDVENLFHCFGCKEGGDIFKYVQEINNLEFQNAIEFVADKYGFKLTYTQTSDNSDFKRKNSPLKKTKDSLLINTTNLTKRSCFLKIKKIIDKKLNY